MQGQFDIIIASDVVYEQSHCQIAQVCLVLLAPSPLAAPAVVGGGGGGAAEEGAAGGAAAAAAAAGGGGVAVAGGAAAAAGGAAGGAVAGVFQPCAIFLLPDSRPRLRDFVAAFADAGLSCKIETVRPSPALVRRLCRTHEGWGTGDASFSLYTVARLPM